MTSQQTSPASVPRREILSRCGTGFGLLGLAGLLSDDSLLPAAQAIQKPGFFKKPGFWPLACAAPIELKIPRGALPNEFRKQY